MTFNGGEEGRDNVHVLSLYVIPLQLGHMHELLMKDLFYQLHWNRGKPFTGSIGVLVFLDCQYQIFLTLFQHLGWVRCPPGTLLTPLNPTTLLLDVNVECG